MGILISKIKNYLNKKKDFEILMDNWNENIYLYTEKNKKNCFFEDINILYHYSDIR